MKKAQNSKIKKSFHMFSIFILFSLLLQEIATNPQVLFKCDPDNSPVYNMNLSNIVKSSKSTKNKRLLDENGYKNSSIFLDTKNLEKEYNNYGLQAFTSLTILVNSMSRAVQTLQSLLKVRQTENYAFDDTALTSISINDWDETKIGSKNKEQKKGTQDLDIDLYIFARFTTKGELNSTSLASAAPKYIDPTTGQPIVGVVNINREFDLTNTNVQHFLETVIIHEFTHILGFSGTLFYKKHLLFTLIDSDNILRIYFNGTKVVNVAKKYYNCQSIKGVELENNGDFGFTTGSHWEARTLLGEYMNGVIYTSEQVISEFTLAALEDLGYYKANYYTGGRMQFGKNKGCEFLNQKCIINGKINEKFGNEFYDLTNGIEAGCSSGRQSRAYRFTVSYGVQLPKPFQYFKDATYGGPIPAADYCPVATARDFNVPNFYTGNCLRGNDNYGADLVYSDKTNGHTSKSVTSFFHEEYSNNSFCVISSMVNEKSSNHEFHAKNPRPVCYAMSCSSKSLSVKINGEYFVCPRAGGKINATGFDGYLLCPDYYLICSGTVMCNDLYDCVDKKSQVKEESYKQDYESRTKQDINVVKGDKFEEDNYELSEDGECAQYCSRCKINSKKKILR